MLYTLRFAFCVFLAASALAVGSDTGVAQQGTASELQITETTEPVKVELIGETRSVQPGHSFWVALHFTVEKEWHAYWKNPGSAGMPPQVEWSLTSGFKVEQLLWPTPKRFLVGNLPSFGYEKEFVLLAQIRAPEGYTEKELTIAADLRWVVCNDSNCLPGDAQLQLRLPLEKRPPEPNQGTAPLFTAARAQLPKQITAEAERKEGLIQLTFQAPEAMDKTEITAADFISEHPHAFNEEQEALLRKAADPQQKYTLLLKEEQALSSIKGVLVLQTSQGAHAFALDMPIAGTPASSEEIVFAGGRESLDEGLPLEDPSAFEGGFAWALLFAFIGGLILNLMPCVLPVISFKILSFVKLAGENRKLIFQHGLAFSSGVILSFWVLAGALILLQAYGRSVGWGFQLQEPLFVAVLAAFLFLFSLSLFGLFELGTGLISAGSQTQQAARQRSALAGSFLSGVLATVVATPCTGPFLGSAVGFAFTLPPLLTLLIFTSIGIGMTAPYLALAAFPSTLRFLPKAGPWMVTFKEIMGFLLMASVLWLVWVFSAQTNMIAINLLLAAFLLLAAAGWIYGRWCTPLKKKTTRLVGLCAALICLTAGVYAVTLAASPAAEAAGNARSGTEMALADGWEPFSAERVAELRQKGIPVFIDFTAKWCLICQANHLVLSKAENSKLFDKLGVVKMKADWTKKDKAITEALRQFGRNSVPLYVLYTPHTDAKPHILPQVLTSDTVQAELKKLEQSL
jgi:thiol:disulfide interchange protein DsbD